MPRRILKWLTADGDRRRFRGIAAWVFAGLILATALALVTVIHSVTGRVTPLGPLYIALVVIACWSGVAPALVSLLFSAIYVSLVITEPFGLPSASQWPAQLSMAIYLLSGGVIVAVSTQLTRSRDDADRTRAQLRDNEARLQLAIEGARIGTWLVDERTNSYFWDTQYASLLGFTRETIPVPSRQLWRERVHPEDLEGALRTILDARARAGTFDLQARIVIPPSGEVRWLSWHGRFIGAPGDTQLRSIGVAMDVTESKSLTGALEQADRRKDAFLATLAHELRNPLAPIRYAVKLLTRITTEENAARAVATIDRQSAQMARLLDDLLDMSRITRDAIELQPALLDLRASVADALETVRPMIEDQRHRLSRQEPGEPVWIRADPTRLAQVIGNVLQNAIKYTDPGGDIDVRINMDADQARLRIRDSGVGIDLIDQQRVFELFSRVSKSFNNPREGLGIGLAIAKRLAELQGGRITVHSEGQGRGSEFTVHWPLAPAPRSEASNVVVPLHAAPHRPVLIADDNIDATDSLAALLRLQGYLVHTAYDGTRALDMAERLQPAVIVLDVGMPGLSGLDVASRIRARPWGAAVTLVALTGWGQDEDRRVTQAAGFDQHLTKPIDPETLLQLLSETEKAGPLARKSTPKPSEAQDQSR